MKAIVIGLGSMGKRRIRLVQKNYKNVEIVGVDSSIARREEVARQFDIEVYSDLKETCRNTSANCAFVCTPPLTHADLIGDCLNLGLHVFSEINLVADEYKRNIELAKEKNLTLFLSSTFLYRKEIEFIKNRVANEFAPINYIYHVGQYLPDWHPWESYKDFFVSHVRSNACRELFAIELPWLTDVFGEIKNFTVSSSKNTSLDIDYNDNYLLIIEHHSGAKGLLAIDVVSRQPVRNLELFSERLYIKWDGSPTGMHEYDFGEKALKSVVLYDSIDKVAEYSHTIIEDAYNDEIREFFDIINGISLNARYSFEKDYDILGIIDEIEDKHE